jgi:hypothetical protein
MSGALLQWWMLGRAAVSWREVLATMTMLRMPFPHGASAGPLRHSVRDLLAPWCSDEQTDDVLVVVSELVQNVTQHTAGGGELVLTADERVVVVEVHDGDPVLPRPQRPDERRVGGRGLLLVAGLTSQWGTRPTVGGKIVWARLDLSSDSVTGVAA